MRIVYSSFVEFVLGLCFISFCGSTVRARVVNYSVSEPSFAIKQVKTTGCWATTAKMLTSWKAHDLLSVEEVLNLAGRPYPDVYKTDTGLFPVEEPGHLKSINLKAEPPQSTSTESLRTWLESTNDRLVGFSGNLLPHLRKP